MTGREILFVAMILLLFPSPASVQSQDGELLIAYNRGLLTLSVENVDLKHVLGVVAEETGISVKYPRWLEKRITTEFRALPLQRGLRRILRGMNYALIYSRSARKKQGDVVTAVYVVSKQSKTSRYTSRASVQNRTPEERRSAAIEKYRRRLDVLERQLGQVGVGSPRGKAIDRQIRILEQRIEKLAQQ
jgi:hypothetical protein